MCFSLDFPRSRPWDKDLGAKQLFGRWKKHQQEGRELRLGNQVAKSQKKPPYQDSYHC